MHTLPVNQSYQILPSTSVANGDNEVLNQITQNKLILPGVITSRYISLVPKLCFNILLYKCAMINFLQFLKNFKFSSQSGGLPMQMKSSLPLLHQRKDNIGIDSAISGGLIHPEIKQEGKKYI